MRIAFISVMEGAIWGGSEELWSKTVVYAIQQGHQVFISIKAQNSLHQRIIELENNGATVNYRRQPFFNPEPKSVHILKLKLNRWRRGFRKAKRLLFSAITQENLASVVTNQEPENIAWHAIESFQPDCICVSQGGCYDVAYMPLKKYLCKSLAPFIIICHSYDEINIPNDEQRTAVIELFEKAQRVCMIAKHQIVTVERQLARHLSNIYQVQNPNNVQSPEIIPFPSMEIVCFASVASLDVIWKGQDLLLEVFGQEIWKERNWELHIYGTGKDLIYLKILSEFYAISNRVYFHGFIPNIKQVWETNHILVNPSRIDSGPMTISEAMLCGRPVIATGIGLSKELIVEDATGFIAEYATVPLLHNTLEKAWKSRYQWEAMGRKAFKTIQERKINEPEAKLLQLLIHNQ